jgi:predicted metalloendopeptidase
MEHFPIQIQHFFLFYVEITLKFSFGAEFPEFPMSYMNLHMVVAGRQFDSEGNLKEWWNNETIRAFRSQTQCIIDQYSQYTVEGFHINGKMTQGENIADNGGLKQAYRVSSTNCHLSYHNPVLGFTTSTSCSLFQF